MPGSPAPALAQSPQRPAGQRSPLPPGEPRIWPYRFCAEALFRRSKNEPMERRMIVRTVTESDFPQWLPLWDGYNSFYGRSGPTALPEPITAATWSRFFDAYEPMHALVAEDRSEEHTSELQSLMRISYAVFRLKKK